MVKKYFFSMFLIAGVVSTTQAQLVNGGFETGDLTGWNASIPAGGWINVVGVGVAGYAAVEGNFYANMKTDGPGSFTTLGQPFNAVNNQTISGWAYFYDQEFAQGQPCNFADRMSVDIWAPGPVLVANVFFSGHCQPFQNGTTPWTFWTYQFDGTEPAGPYAVVGRITNIGDSIVDSTSGMDGLELDISVDIDIKFCSDPNAFNCKKNGVLPVTIFGTADFDVTTIDFASLRLCLESDLSTCTAGGPRDWTFDDRGDPTSDIGAAQCALIDTDGDGEPDTEADFLNPDGFLDVDVVFEASDVQALLGDFCTLGAKGDVSESLVIVGTDLNGTTITSPATGGVGVDQLLKQNK